MMNTRYALLGLALLGLLLSATCSAQQAQPAAQKPSLDIAVLNTAAQAWDLTGKDTAAYSQMINEMVALAALNRGVTVPNTRESGEFIGRVVMRDANADPDRLLYDIVDHAVVMTLACASPTPASFVAPSPADEATPDWTLGEVVTATVSQAWDMSGKSRPEFNKMLNQTLALAMENRGIAVEDTKEAGMRLGAFLRADLESHPNDLLYSVVDRALLQTAATVPTAAEQN